MSLLAAVDDYIMDHSSRIGNDAIQKWYHAFADFPDTHGFFSPEAADSVDRDVNVSYRGRYDINHFQNGRPTTARPTRTHPDMHRVSKTLIDDDEGSLAQVIGACYAQIYSGRNHPAVDDMRIIINVYRAACHLKMIHRFLSERQSQCTRLPTNEGAEMNDGSINPSADPLLLYEWHFKRNFVRLLHYPGIVKDPSNEGAGEAFDPFTEIYGLSRLLVEAELEKIGLEPYHTRPQTNDPQEVDNARVLWVQNSRDKLGRILESGIECASAKDPRSGTFKAAFAAAGRAGLQMAGQMAGQKPPTTPGERSANRTANLGNMDKSIAAAKNIRKQLERDLADSPFERLLVEIINLECEFETALGETHVEDKLFEKQISALHEFHFANLRDNPQLPTLFINPGKFDIPTIVLFDTILRRSLQDTGLVNLQRRNFRMFRDWAGERPFQRIFQIYDSRIEGREWLRQPIEEFKRDTLQGLSRKDDNPSSYINMMSKVFLFSPYDLGSVPPSGLEGFLEPCGICKKGLLPDQGFDSSVVQLYCERGNKPVHPNSIFHLKCIFRYWDMEGIYVQRCPICRVHNDLNYRRLGYSDYDWYEDTDKFVHNIWGWYGVPELSRNENDEADVSGDLSEMNVPSTSAERGYRLTDDEENRNTRRYNLHENRHVLAVKEAAGFFPVGRVDFPPTANPIADFKLNMAQVSNITGVRPTFNQEKILSRTNLDVARITGIQPSDPVILMNDMMQQLYKVLMQELAPLDEPDPVKRMSNQDKYFPNRSIPRRLNRVHMENPETEQVWLRHMRRKRDRIRRRQVAERGVGLAGLTRRNP